MHVNHRTNPAKPQMVHRVEGLKLPAKFTYTILQIEEKILGMFLQPYSVLSSKLRGERAEFPMLHRSPCTTNIVGNQIIGDVQ